MSDVNEVEQFLLKLGDKLKRTPDQMKPIINKLVKENWLETLDSLRALSDEEWYFLNLPLRLVDEIKKELFLKSENKNNLLTTRSCSFSDYSFGDPSHQVSSVPTRNPNAALNLAVQKSEGKNDSNRSESDVANPSFTPHPSHISNFSSPSQSFQDFEKDKNFINFDIPNDEIFPMSILTAMENLQFSIPSDIMPSVLRTLLKLIDGVLGFPSDKSKRKIRKANENFLRKVGKFSDAVNVLLAVGFKDCGETLELATAYISRLTDCHNALCELCSSFKIAYPPLPQSSFNPYTPSITATSASANVLNNLTQRFAEIEQIQQAIKERDHLIRSGGNVDYVPLNPKVFTMSKINKIEDAINELQKTNTNEVESELSFSLAEATKIKEVITEQNLKFKSRAKLELEKLNKKKIFKQCVLRITFPDQLILQLNFKPSDKIFYVKEQIKRFLAPSVRDRAWYICETPPIRRLDSRKTIYDEGLVPGAVLHFKVEDGKDLRPPYLVESLLRDVDSNATFS